MRGIFTRDERAVVLFLAAALAVGSAVLLVRRVEPAADGSSWAADGECRQPAVRAEPEWPVDLNSATEQELTALPGIGPVRAAAVVELREDRGRFSSVEELLEVKGIGPKTLERVRPLVSLDGGDVAESSGRRREEAGGDREDR